MRTSKSIIKMVVIAQSFIKNGRNGDAYRYKRRFVPFQKVRKSANLLDIAECKIFSSARSIGIPDCQIAKDARSPDRKRSQIESIQHSSLNFARARSAEIRQIGKRQNAPDRLNKTDRQIGTARSAPDHFRLARVNT